MADLQTLIRAVDELSQDELDKLYVHVLERRQSNWWIVPPENIAKIEEVMHNVHTEAAHMSEDEINQAIDQAIAEVRRERKPNRRV